MSTNKFNIGDKVVFVDRDWKLGKNIEYLGIVLKVLSTGRYSIQFGENFNTKFGLGIVYNSFSDENLVLAGPPLTKEERLLKKCKKLWNTSKYVLKNPERAY